LREQIYLTFETVTPLLLDGFHHPQSGQLRASSVIGILRFWLRALCGHNYSAADGAVFGARGIPSSVSLRMIRSNIPDKKPKFDDSVLYLACGLQRHRTVPEGASFQMCFSLNGDEQIKRLLFCALRALTLFGGLGARRRRGFGAVKISSDSPTELLPSYNTPEAIAESINSLIKEAETLSAQLNPNPSGDKKNLPSTSFANEETEIYVSRNIYTSPMEALAYAGGLLKNWRNYSHSRESRKDHDLVYEYARTGEIDNVPLRAIFGMPHHYFLRNLGEGKQASVTFEPAASNRRITRRASPLFISVVPLTDNRATLVFSLFRSQFMPRSVSIQVHGSIIKDKERTRLPFKIIGRHPSWLALLTFTDHLISSGEFFPIRRLEKHFREKPSDGG